MQILRISKGGQISIPARIRRRWGAQRLLLDDRGNELVIIPVPTDPIAAVRGSFKSADHTVEGDRERMRQEDVEIEERKRDLHH
jgi:bifunctional DNA-binding transcriptional regulator/antitoxin component of YhaV-PrlF toxin-antitoxin module